MFDIFIKAFLNWLVQGAVEGWKTTCKFALQAGNITDNQWDAATQMVGHLGGVMLMVCIITAAVNIVRMVTRKRFDLAVLVFSQAILSWPLTMISQWLLARIETIAASVTGSILNMDFSGAGAEYSMVELSKGAVTSATTAFGPVLMVLFLLLILLSMVSIVICMAARDFLLLMSVSFISVQFMNIVEGQLNSIKRYFYFVLGLILYQPVCASMIWLTGELMKRSGGDNALTFIMALVGMGLSSVAPWVLIRKILPVFGPARTGLDAAARNAEGTVKTTKAVTEKAASVAASAVGGGKAPVPSAVGKGAGLLGSFGGKKNGPGGGAPGVVSVDTKPDRQGPGQGNETPPQPQPQQEDPGKPKASSAVPDMRRQGKEGLERLAAAARTAANERKKAAAPDDRRPVEPEEDPPAPVSALPTTDPIKGSKLGPSAKDHGTDGGLSVDPPPAPDDRRPVEPPSGKNHLPPEQPAVDGGAAPALPDIGSAASRNGAEGVGGVAPAKGSSDIRVDKPEQ